MEVFELGKEVYKQEKIPELNREMYMGKKQDVGILDGQHQRSKAEKEEPRRLRCHRYMDSVVAAEKMVVERHNAS